LGIVLAKLNKSPQAKDEFAKAMDLDPNYAKPLFCRMNLHREAGDYELALADAKKIIQIDPEFQRNKLDRHIIPELENLRQIEKKQIIEGKLILEIDNLK